MHIKKTLLSLFLIFEFIGIEAQTFRNLDFKDACDASTTGLCSWDLSWGNRKNINRDITTNKPALLLTGNSKNSVVFVEQSVSNAVTETSIITVTANISSADVEGKGAGLNINLYNSDNELLSFRDMGGFYSTDWISGTRSGKDYSISLICPPGTAKIKIGAILYGSGKAWFKNYKVIMATIAKRKPSKLAKKYITAACDTIKKHSLFRDSFNLQKKKATALQIAGNAKTYSECYLAINYLLESLREYGDYHSFFMKALEVENWRNNGSTVSKVEFPSYKRIDDLGYINVPAFHSGNSITMLAYADTLQLALRELLQQNIKGWIIDLRENTGGNMEPMIAGLGPLFSSEKLGSLVDVEHKSDSWYYKNGRYCGDGYEGWSVTNPVFTNSRLPIAVITSNKVGSSGEIVVISFKENVNTKFFGQPTMGLTTGNGSFDLEDGAKMFLASSIMADRTGKQYHGSINPDFKIDKMIEKGRDNALNAAIEWIKSLNK